MADHPVKGVVLYRITTAVALLGWVAMIISCGITDYHIDLPGGYRIWHNHAHCTSISSYEPKDQAKNQGELPSIDSLVTQVAWDKRYILAEQELMIRHSPGDCCGVRTGKYQFWILDTRDDRLHGPFTTDQFASQRVALGVDPALELAEPRTFLQAD
ncbi:MAG: DUF3997 domain-containing protein [Bacteroidales bacterium]|nr:DUF3997 domain-containing protein [Bacteroidales bacterium]